MTDKLIEQIKRDLEGGATFLEAAKFQGLDIEARRLADAEALKAADELAVLALNTGCSTQEDADRLRDKVATYNEKRGERE
jgi:hypothetical protein